MSMDSSPADGSGASPELLRLALHNSARRSLLHIAALCVVVLMGLTAGRPIVAIVAAAIGVATIVWLVRTAAVSGSSLMAILNDGLDHSKIEAGKLNLVYAPLSLHGVTSSAVALFRASAEA